MSEIIGKRWNEGRRDWKKIVGQKICGINEMYPFMKLQVRSQNGYLNVYYKDGEVLLTDKTYFRVLKLLEAWLIGWNMRNDYAHLIQPASRIVCKNSSLMDELKK